MVGRFVIGKTHMPILFLELFSNLKGGYSKWRSKEWSGGKTVDYEVYSCFSPMNELDRDFVPKNQ